MAFRRSLGVDAENADQDQSPDVEGHAIRSGRLARVKADGPAGPETADTGVADDGDDVEGHAFKSGRKGEQPS